MSEQEKNLQSATAANFPSKLNIRLDWSEMDMFGHINNVMFFKFIQASRVNYWEISQFHKDYADKKVGPLLVSSSCQFRKPLFYPGNIVVEARVDFIKNSSMGIHHRILNDKGELAAEAQDVVVLFDFTKNTSVSIPQNIRLFIEELEDRKF
ncbi:MAG TPA: acyl-CoA thioesterase [Bacteroidia bacterium]|jgi:acyl-CoA thioester hydrolase|nr:acyl-CoA thioesterase [Bacteroidia bacterium]